MCMKPDPNRSLQIKRKTWAKPRIANTWEAHREGQHYKRYKKYRLHLLKVQGLHNLHYVQVQHLVEHWPTLPLLFHHQRPLDVLVELDHFQAWPIGEKYRNHRLGKLKILTTPVEDEMQEEEAEGVEDAFQWKHLGQIPDCYVEKVVEEAEIPVA